MPQVKLSLGSLGGVVQTQYSGNVQAGPDNCVTVDSRDAPALIALGASYVNQVTRTATLSAPAAGAVGAIVASAACSNGTLTLAAQPDVPRVCSVRVDPGTSAISAGTITFPYIANDGTNQTDSFSIVTGASTVSSQNTSKAVAHASAPIVSGLVGGASPHVQIDTLNYIGVAVDSGFQDFTLLKANIDASDNGGSTVNSSAGAILPSSAPNGTHNYSFLYSYTAPVA